MEAAGRGRGSLPTPFDTGSTRTYRASKPTPKSVAQRFMNHSSPQRRYWIPNADVFIAPSGDLIVCVELSGMQTDDFEINTEGTKLRITGKRPDSGIATAQDALVHEINAGPFESVLDIPPDFDLWRLSSAYVNGTLRITVPPGPNRS